VDPRGVDLDTILAAYTRGGAYLQHEEALTGSLEVGKRADVIVLEKNLFEIPETAIHRVKVLLTLLDGKEVFRDSSFPPSRQSN
jgi:predicted amidohydrolase YtcJ